MGLSGWDNGEYWDHWDLRAFSPDIARSAIRRIAKRRVQAGWGTRKVFLVGEVCLIELRTNLPLIFAKRSTYFSRNDSATKNRVLPISRSCCTG